MDNFKATIVIEQDNVKMEFNCVSIEAYTQFSIWPTSAKDRTLRLTVVFLQRASRVWVDGNCVKSRYSTEEQTHSLTMNGSIWSSYKDSSLQKG